MPFFLLLVALVLFGSHYFLYHNIVKIYSISNYKIILFFVFFVLSMSFLVFTIYAHFYHNLFARIFYYISSFWLIIVSNLFFLFIIFWILLFIFRYFNISHNTKLIWSLFIIFAVLISIYWVYNANNPKIKEVEIQIKNLPKSWEDKKIIMFSDLHLWAIIREKFLEKIIAIVNKQNPDIIFIPWDFFDWTDWNLDHLKEEINKFEAKDWIFYSFWNHETYQWYEKTTNMLSWTKVQILRDQFINIDWVQILGIDFVEWYSSNDKIKEKLSNLEKSWFDKNTSSILLFHTPLFLEEFKNFWINLHVAWHTHKWQLWPYNYITKLVYKWKDYWLYTDWNYNLYTTNWIWTWWPPARIWNSPEIVVLKLN